MKRGAIPMTLTQTIHVPIGSTLLGACSVVLGLVACGPSVGTPVDSDGSTSEAAFTGTGDVDSGVFPEPRPPDLGPDVVICGQPGEGAATDEELAALEGCEIYEGYVSMDYPNVTSLAPLSSIRIIHGAIDVPVLNPGLETLEGLENVGWVGSMQLEAEALKDMSALRSLTNIESLCHLEDLPLTNLHGLEQLRTVGGSLRIKLNPELTGLEGLAGLEWIGGDLTIGGNDRLESLEGMAALRQVVGDVFITQNPMLSPVEIDAFVDRIEIGGVLHVNE